MALRRDAQLNRERIVAIARELFASEGIEVPVEEVTRRAGVGMGTLYRHFPAKEDLVDAVLEDAFDAYVGLARQALTGEDAWAGFRTFLEDALALHAANRCLRDVITKSEHGRARAQAARTRIRPLLKQLVERAQAQGSLRADFAAEDFPLLFWAAGGVIEATEGVAPGCWRRQLGLMLDGLRAAAATPLDHPPLTRMQLARTTRRGA